MDEGSLMRRRLLFGLAAFLFMTVCLSAGTFPQATGLSMSLSGSTGDPETDLLLLDAVEKGVRRSLESRVDFSVEASGPVETTLGDPKLDMITFEPQIRFTAWLRLSYGGESFTTGVAVLGKNLKEIARELSSVVTAQLRYDALDLLPIESDGLTLDYVWRNSLSSWVDENSLPVKKGDRLLVQGVSSKSEALVVVNDIIPYEGRTVAAYDPVYVRNPQPGMPLSPGPNWTGTIEFPVTVVASGLFGVGAEFSAMRSMGWYPWAPVMKAGLCLEISKPPTMTLQGLSVYAMGGMQVDVPLGGLFDTSFTLIEDASIGAACLVGFGARIPFDQTDTVFIFGGEWEVWYRHTPSVHWGWGVGFGSQYWAKVDAGKVQYHRLATLTIAPSVVFSW
ncbi:MAG: hypothetical protein SPD11_15165 [Sphaerochaetaceae bacterium]|nr:hypothetical protein [Sphaerochaetaceae bacterium]